MGFNINERGYIIYTRESENTYWKKIRQAGEDKIYNKELKKANYLSVFNKGRVSSEKIEEIASFLQELGRKEEIKERKYLSKYNRKQENNQTDVWLIKNMNEIISGENLFKATIEDFMNKYKELGRDKNQNIEKGSLSPFFLSTFSSDISVLLNIKFKQFLENHSSDFIFDNNGNIINGNSYQNELQQMLIDTINEAFEKKVNKIIKSEKTNETKKQAYQEILDIYNNLEAGLKNSAENPFYQAFARSYGVDNFLNVFKTEEKDLKRYLNGELKRVNIPNRALKITQSVAQAGGNFMEAFSEIFNGGKLLKGKVVINKKAKIDVILGELSLDDIGLADFKGSDLIESHKALDYIYQKNFRNNKSLGKQTVIFVSDKLYGFHKNKSSEIISNDDNRPLNQLPDILANLQGTGQKITRQKADAFLEVIRNTMEGAILSNRFEEIETSLEFRIYESLAYLLFDSWSALGEDVSRNSRYALHLFNIGNIYIPISWLLKQAAEAISDTNNDYAKRKDFFRFYLKQPKISFLEVKDYPKVKDKNGEERPSAIKAFYEQREDADREWTFSTKFLANYNKRIFDLVKRMY